MAANFAAAANFATEEAFVHATVREFVKLWGNGSRAHLQVQCLGGQAWVQLMSAIGPPSSPHLFRQDNHHHGSHGPHLSQHRRRKGAKQRDRDRARAALHRASLLEAAAAKAAAPDTLHHAQRLLPPSPLHTCQEDLREYHQSSPHSVEEVVLVHHPPHPDEDEHPVPPLSVPELTHHGDDSTPQRDTTRAAVHRRRLGLDSLGLTVVHPQPDNLPPGGPLPEVGQVALPRAGNPADDLPHKAGNPADDLPHKAGNPAGPLDPPIHHTTLSYSAVAKIFPKTPARLSDQPGSPAGWGAVDPTRAESDSESEATPVQQATLVRQQYGVDLSSFCFSSPPLQHPPTSSSRRPSQRLH